ncbi:MAG: hypothetical protein WC119_09900 [Synergistaceae bacterium]
MTPFQLGDYRCLKVIRGFVQAVVGQETSSDELDCLNRLIEEARQFERMERQAALPLDVVEAE